MEGAPAQAQVQVQVAPVLAQGELVPAQEAEQLPLAPQLPAPPPLSDEQPPASPPPSGPTLPPLLRNPEEGLQSRRIAAQQPHCRPHHQKT